MNNAIPCPVNTGDQIWIFEHRNLPQFEVFPIWVSSIRTHTECFNDEINDRNQTKYQIFAYDDNGHAYEIGGRLYRFGLNAFMSRVEAEEARDAYRNAEASNSAQMQPEMATGASWTPNCVLDPVATEEISKMLEEGLEAYKDALIYAIVNRTERPTEYGFMASYLAEHGIFYFRKHDPIVSNIESDKKEG